jgi:hypothetical protein
MALFAGSGFYVGLGLFAVSVIRLGAGTRARPELAGSTASGVLTSLFPSLAV